MNLLNQRDQSSSEKAGYHFGTNSDITLVPTANAQIYIIRGNNLMIISNTISISISINIGISNSISISISLSISSIDIRDQDYL